MHELPWLLEPVTDFNTRCSQLIDHSSPVSEVMILANSALSINQSNRLYKALKQLQLPPETGKQLSDTLIPFKLGVVSNATMDLFIPSMVIAALRCGIELDVVASDFGQIAQEAFDPSSTLNQASLDAVLLALDFRAYPNTDSALGDSKASSEQMLQFLGQIQDAFQEHSHTLCITQTLACPPVELAGNFDRQLAGTLRQVIAEFNLSLAKHINAHADVMLDVAAMANMVGTYQWFDERQWFLSRVPMANRFIPLYSDYLAKLIAALRGKSKKCLVLDLDNTLWGGVIGDDGLDGIQIGQGHPVGESFLSIQQWAKDLKQLGVILAVCSKNNEDIAREVFREHPGMLLKEEDISVFVANWDDKASNIRYIAETLNIGLDSIVFLDDNPAEREIVRTMLPEVSVPELPRDPSQILRIVCAARYFEKIDYTADDVQRNQQYASNAKREHARQSASSLEEYLASLDMQIRFSPFDTLGRKRIVQLINKTNQFNLTTQRYTEAEVIQFEQDKHSTTLQIHLSDRFGDNGMISVLICRTVEDCWEIDTWLMSCRVIKRKVEESVCNELVALARQQGIRLLRGFYRPTVKNKLVQSHYQNLGFERVATDTVQDTWELAVAHYQPKPVSIQVMQSVSGTS